MKRTHAFNDPRLLRDWKASGVWPAIHEPIFKLISEELTGRRVLDVGCSFGLLGARIRRELDVDAVYGIDSSDKGIQAGIAAGLPIELGHHAITHATLPWLVTFMQATSIDAVVLRRVVPEIFTADQSWGRAFTQALYDGGARQLFLQGRVYTQRSTHPIPCLDAELIQLGVTNPAGTFTIARLTGRSGSGRDCAYLRANR